MEGLMRNDKTWTSCNIIVNQMYPVSRCKHACIFQSAKEPKCTIKSSKADVSEKVREATSSDDSHRPEAMIGWTLQEAEKGLQHKTFEKFVHSAALTLCNACITPWFEMLFMVNIFITFSNYFKWQNQWNLYILWYYRHNQFMYFLFNQKSTFT